jgi:hypothetical protein
MMSEVGNPGCVILLLDESASMAGAMGDLVSGGEKSTKSTVERVATALNALLKQLARGPNFDIALVGYQSDAKGTVDVGPRWGGALAGRDFVEVAELAAHPLRVETRTRKIPSPSGFGVEREETVEFPVWYAPTLGVKAPQVAAFKYCHELICRWAATAGPNPGVPLVLHISGGGSSDGNPHAAVTKFMELATPAGPVLLLQAHVAGNAEVVTAAYPCSHVYLTMGSARDLFRRCSLLPPHLVSALKQASVNVNPNARGLIYNAKISDLIRCFGLVAAHTKGWPAKTAPVPVIPAVEAPATPVADIVPPVVDIPPPLLAAAPLVADDAPPVADVVSPIPAELSLPADALAIEAVLSEEPPAVEPAAPVCEKTALIALLLNRSVEDPYGENVNNAFTKLQDQANDVLKQIAGIKDVAIDVALVSYGQDPLGEIEVRSGFDGPLAGQVLVRQSDLLAGALRVEEYEEEVSNGIGGLIALTRKKPIFCELEPTVPASPAPAATALAQILGDWCCAHRNACLAPIVVHFTRGCCNPEQSGEAAAQLLGLGTNAGPVTLYHLAITETPHKSLAYPDSDAEIATPELRKLWELSSPLLGQARLAETRPSLGSGARGMVINGKFDLLLDEVKQRLTN